MATESNLAGRYVATAWLFHEGKRVRPGSLVELSHDEAERALAQKTARKASSEELDAADKAESHAGIFVAVSAFFHRGRRHAPGALLELSHEDARAALEHKTARRATEEEIAAAEEAEEADDESAEAAPEASAQDATAVSEPAPAAAGEAPKKPARKGAKPKADAPSEPPAAS